VVWPKLQVGTSRTRAANPIKKWEEFTNCRLDMVRIGWWVDRG
jgi:hypothetical protein